MFVNPNIRVGIYIMSKLQDKVMVSVVKWNDKYKPRMKTLPLDEAISFACDFLNDYLTFSSNETIENKCNWIGSLQFVTMEEARKGGYPDGKNSYSIEAAVPQMLWSGVHNIK